MPALGLEGSPGTSDDSGEATHEWSASKSRRPAFPRTGLDLLHGIAEQERGLGFLRAPRVLSLLCLALSGRKLQCVHPDFSENLDSRFDLTIRRLLVVASVILYEVDA